MFFSAPSFLRRHSLLTSALCLSVAFHSGCNSTDSDSPSDEQGKKDEDTKKEDGNNKKDTGKKDTGKKDEAETEKQEEEEVSSKKVKLELKGDPIDKKKLRVVIHPEVTDGKNKLKLGKPMFDAPAKFKDGIMKVTIPPVPESEDLGEEAMTFLLTTLFVDKDDSEDYSKGDLILAIVHETPVYSRPGNPEGQEEWLRLDIGTGSLAPINKALEFVRLDDNTEVDSLVYSVKTKNLAEKLGVIATISQDEMQDFSKNFQKEERVLVTSVDKESERLKLKLEKKPDEARMSDELPSFLPKFARSSLSFLGAFEGDEAKVTKDSKYLSMGCIPMSAEDAEEPHYMVVANLWLEPSEGWLPDPQTAFDAVSMDYRPGWNAVGIQTGFDGSIFASTLIEEDLELIRFDEACELKVQELLHR